MTCVDEVLGKGSVGRDAAEAMAERVVDMKPLLEALAVSHDDAAAYEAASAEVMAVLLGMNRAAVEVLGWAEAFVGVRTSDPEGLPRSARSCPATRATGRIPAVVATRRP